MQVIVFLFSAKLYVKTEGQVSNKNRLEYYRGVTEPKGYTIMN